MPGKALLASPHSSQPLPYLAKSKTSPPSNHVEKVKTKAKYYSEGAHPGGMGLRASHSKSGYLLLACGERGWTHPRSCQLLTSKVCEGGFGQRHPRCNANLKPGLSEHSLYLLMVSFSGPKMCKDWGCRDNTHSHGSQ